MGSSRLPHIPDQLRPVPGLLLADRIHAGVLELDPCGAGDAGDVGLARCVE